MGRGIFSAAMSKKEKIGLMLAFAVVAMAVSDRLLLGPISERIRELDSRIDVAEKQLGQYVRYIGQKDAVAKGQEGFSLFIRQIVSDEEEASAILSEIEQLARNSGVKLLDMKPQPARQIDFHREYYVEIETEADMGQLVDFLYQLNNSSRLLRAKRLRLGPKGKGSPVVRAYILVSEALVPI